MSTTTELIINTYEELKTFRDNVNNRTNTFKTVKLGADIDMNGDDWTPIGFNNGKTLKNFSGTFDGQGHTISNMKIDITGTNETNNLYFGLFGYGGSLYIKNLILDNPIIYNSTNNFLYDDKKVDYVSFLCGYNSQTTNAITNCRIINGHININNAGKYINNIVIGCICSHCLYSSSYNITNCYVEVEFNIRGNILPYFGGIARNNGFLNKCGVKITGLIDLNLKRYSSAIIINGLTNLTSTNNLQITNCYVHMNFKFNIYARPINSGYNQVICGIGYNSYSYYTPKISNCYVISNIELNTSTPGNTFYYSSSNKATATNCYSLINLLLRQYGKTNITQLIRNTETLQYNIVYANDTQYSSGTISYSGTYTESKTLEDDLISGKICYLLNGNQSEINFYQSLNFDKYPILDNKHYVVNNPSTDTYTNTSNVNYIYDIWTYDDLMQFKAAVNTIGKTAYENKTVNLHRDFDLNNERWTPILWFYGTFNGNGHKITNFYMDLSDIYLISDTNSSYGLSFFAAAKVNDFSIETTIKGTYPKTTQLYLAALTYKGSCENVNVFVTYQECNISITGLYDFYWGGICALKYSDSDNSFKNCKLNMYLRNCNVTMLNNTQYHQYYYMYIYGLCYDCITNNSDVLLSIDNTNTIINNMDNIYISGISRTGTSTLCNSYLNCNNDITSKLTLGGIMAANSATTDCNIVSCFSFVNFNGTINSVSAIGGLAGNDIGTIQKSYCVSNYNITINGSYCNIGGICGSAIYGSSKYITDCYVDTNIIYTTNDITNNRIGFITVKDDSNDSVYYSGSITKTSSSGSITPITQGIKLSDDAFKSGEVCYKLNDVIGSTVFYQSIGSNYYPTFNSNEWEVLYDSSKEIPYYNVIPTFNDKISSYADLITFRNLVNNETSGNTFENKTITLSSDIDMKGDEWIPIGTYSHPFKGVFKGNNHTIRNFKIYCDKNHSYCGLFGAVLYPGSIYYLNIDNIFIDMCFDAFNKTQIYCGSLCGRVNFNSTNTNITNFVGCHTNDCKMLLLYSCSDIYSYIGGLIGNSFSTVKIDNCSVKNTILDICGHYVVCGLVVNTDNPTITNSYCNIDIKYRQLDSAINADIYGFTGSAYVTDCYSINTIQVKNLDRGIISGFAKVYDGSITSSYVITDIDVEINNTSANNVYINGFSHYDDNISTCYINPNITYKIIKKTGTIRLGNFSGYLSYKTTNYVVDNSITNYGTIAPSNTYYGSSYYNIMDAYQFRNGYVCDRLDGNDLSPFYQTLYSDPYPVLDSTHQPVHIYSNNFYNTLYSLSSYDNILFFYQLLESGYTYENEIVEVSSGFSCNAKSLTPSTKEFKGTLEGNNLTIRNFKLLTDNYYRAGIISNSSGTIQNLILSNVTLYDTKANNNIRQIGFICGYSVGTITNCHVTNGIVNLNYISTAAYIGGIVGYHNNSLYKCSVDMTVNNVISSSPMNIYMGGIIGYIIGSTSDDPSTISYCCSNVKYNLNISLESAQYKIGGICSNTCQVNNCYSNINYNLNLTSSGAVIYLGGFFGLRSLYPAANINKWSNVYTDTTITYSNSNSNNQLYLNYIIPTDTISATTYKSKVYAVNNKVTNLGSYGYTNAYITDTYYTPIIKHDFSDGTVCYGLNNNQSDNPVFYQRINLDEYPALINNTSIVKQINGILATTYIGITTYEELKGIATLTNAGKFIYSYVQLLNDIDMNNYVNGETWTPIGTSSNHFKAILNGNYHTIYNMIINSANQEITGFIAYSGNTIQNLNIDRSCKIMSLSTSTITLNQHIGMLCGIMSTNCNIYSCDIKGYIDIKNFSGELRIGGLGYYSNGGSCFNCNVEPIITVESNYDSGIIQIGGIISVSSYTIRYCNIHPSINIINNVSNRTQNINIGGVVCNSSTSNNNIMNTFCDTHINIIDPYYTSSNKYNLNTILIYTTSRKEYIYSLGNLITVNNQLFIESDANKKYTDISIDQIKNGYLCFNVLNDNSTSEIDWYQNLREDYYPTIDNTHQIVYKLLDNKVYINKKYNINSYDDFINFRNEINGITTSITYSCDFYLNCDINLNNIDWVPINYNNYVTFSGTFYGNNHIISQLSLNHSTYRWTGLFGFCIGLKFKDLIISKSIISVTPKAKGEMNGASFLGYGITTIDNCYVTGSYFNILNGFNTDNNIEIYAGLGISLSGYQSRVVNCTNCSVNLTYEVVETITRTSSKNILMSGIISNSINNQNSSANISYTENVFSNCYANITFNKFEVVTIYYYYGCICSDFNYVKIENCHSNVQTKDVVTITGTSSGSLAWHNFAGIIMDDNVINYNSNKYYVNVYVNKCWSNIDYDSSLINSYLIGIVYNPSYTNADKSTFATNCYSIIQHDYRIKIYSGEDKTLGIILKGNASNCYSVIKGYFVNVAPTAIGCIVTMGGIAEQRNSSLTVTNNYSHVRVFGSIQDGTISNYRVILSIGGILSSNDTEIKSSNYAVSYTTDEITNSLSGTKYTIYNYGTTDYVTAITKDDFTNGKVCYGLNGDQTNINFYQYLKESNYPTLNSNYPKVLLKSSNYINPTTITEINNKYDLLVFRDSVNGGENYTNTTININVDIDLDGMNWTPIDNINYDGILQGNGHTISNFTIQKQQYCGFFGSLYDNAEIHNLTLDNVTIQGSFSIDNTDDIYNCCGVLCGLGSNINMSNCNITNCKIDISYSTSTAPSIYIGGLLGQIFVYLNDKCKITNCNVINTTIKITLNSDGLACYVGGLFANRDSSKKTQLTNSSFNGNITIDNTNGINTRYCSVSGLVVGSTDINSCYTINSIKIINGRDINIVGISINNHTITNTFCKSIINVSSYTTDASIEISGISCVSVSTDYINNVYADNQIFYNNQTTDATKIKIGQISSDKNETDANSTINIVPNQIINLGTTEATINDKVTGYNTIRKEDFNNGKVCYGLNTNGTYFYQIIGIDPYPILTNNNSTVKELSISIYPSPLNLFYYNNDFDGNIYSYYDLCLFRNLVNSGTDFKKQTINLHCDIDMNGDEWIPIGCAFEYPFKGSFNGNNHVIKNMTLRLNLLLGTTATYRCIGLFGIVGDTEQSDNIMIKDIIIDKTCSMKYNKYTGDIYCSYLVGRLNKGTIDNCKIYADVRLNNASNQIYYGSFTGDININNCIISNCYVNNNIVTNNMSVMLISAIAINTNTISDENTTKYINNNCVINIRLISDKELLGIVIIGLIRPLVENESININNYVNNCLLINTTILDDIIPALAVWIHYSIEQLNSNNYVNNDYPFIKNTDESKTSIALGTYPSEDFKSGKICYLLNGNQSNIKFYQNLLINADIAPIPDNSHQQVYKSTTNNIDTYYNRPLNELPTQQLAVTIYNLANPTLLYNINISNNNFYQSLYYNDINFALSANNSFYSITQSIEKYIYDIYHSSKNYKLESINLIYFKFKLFNEIIKKKLTIGDVIMYNEIFAKLVNNLPIELVKTELNYYKRLCFYLRDKNALDTEHYNLIFGDE